MSRGVLWPSQRTGFPHQTSRFGLESDCLAHETGHRPHLHPPRLALQGVPAPENASQPRFPGPIGPREPSVRQDAKRPGTPEGRERQDALAPSAPEPPARQDALAPGAPETPTPQDALVSSVPETPAPQDALAPSAPETPARQDALAPSAAFGESESAEDDNTACPACTLSE